MPSTRGFGFKNRNFGGFSPGKRSQKPFLDCGGQGCCIISDKIMPLNPDNEWEKFGKLDPYFGVFTDNLSEEQIIEFFDSGENQLELFLRIIKQHLDPNFTIINALDFGCGVGRVLIPLARISSFVLGIDISDSMLKKAEKNCQVRNIKNVSLIKNKNHLSNISQTFNFIHSYLVFQHIPPNIGYILTERLIALLEDNGIGVLTYTYAKKISMPFVFINWLRHKSKLVNGLINTLKKREFNYPAMQMNNYNLNKLFAILYANRCYNLFLKFTYHAGYYGVIIFFNKSAYDDSPVKFLLTGHPHPLQQPFG